jgi:hypothetical protein
MDPINRRVLDVGEVDEVIGATAPAEQADVDRSVHQAKASRPAHGGLDARGLGLALVRVRRVLRFQPAELVLRVVEQPCINVEWDGWRILHACAVDVPIGRNREGLRR